MDLSSRTIVNLIFTKTPSLSSESNVSLAKGRFVQMSKKPGDNPTSVLAMKVESLEKCVGRVELALYGPDGTNGMARDIADIKSSLRLWGQLKTFGLGIASTVIAAIIIAKAAGII
jgi:hypothetical protein